MKIYDSVLELIGNTPLVHLNRIKKDLKTSILAKLEYYNPSGSVKDRIALFMIEDAEKQGKIKKGDCIVEPTSGNTGTSLALVCALKGYHMIAVMPEQMSQERKDMMTAFGAELVLVPSQDDAEPGTFTKEDVEAKATACRLARLEGIFAGYSAGANVFCSLKVAREIGEDKTVVTVIPDSGMKYLSTELFHHSPEVCTIHCCNLEKPEMREECQKGATRCCVLEPCD